MRMICREPVAEVSRESTSVSAAAISALAVIVAAQPGEVSASFAKVTVPADRFAPLRLVSPAPLPEKLLAVLLSVTALE